MDNPSERGLTTGLRPTLVADVVVPVGTRMSSFRAALSALLVTLVSGTLLLALGLSQAGVFAVFLTATALGAPLSDLLQDNREAIWVRREKAWRANGRTVLGLLGIFFGMGVAFTVLAVWLGEAEIHRAFGFATESVGPTEHLLQRRFGPWPVLLQRNLIVLAVLIILAIAFRSHGALLVLGWNAAAWSGVLVLLILRAIPQTNLPPERFTTIASLALMPHIILEAAAYVVAALGAIFLSRGMVRYRPVEARFRRVLSAGATLVTTAVGLLVVAAVVEDYWASSILKWLSRQ